MSGNTEEPAKSNQQCKQKTAAKNGAVLAIQARTMTSHAGEAPSPQSKVK